MIFILCCFHGGDIMDSKPVFYILLIFILILVALDFIISFIGITILNITEWNPLYHYFGLLDFFIIKLITSIIALRLLYYLKENNLNTGIWGASFLCGMYGIVFINNMYIIGCIFYE